MRVRTFTGGGFAENGYLMTCAATGVAVAVDPGAAADEMVEALRGDGTPLAAILLTHAHLDHVEGIHVVREAFPDVPLWLHPADRRLYQALPQQGAAFGLALHPQPDPDRELAHGDVVPFGECEVEVRHAPGHSPGHVVFIARDAGIAFVGDVIFQGSIGRTDLPGGDFYTLMRSIREQVLTLPDDMILYPGHGRATKVGDERTGNPFLMAHFGGRMA